jgi:DNA polymerase (family 10)
MPVTNATIAEILHRYATTLAAAGADRFRVNAYYRAAEAIQRLSENVSSLVRQGRDLQTLPGIGPAISRGIEEIIRTGKLARMDEIRGEMSPEMAELTTRPGLDPKRVLRIYKKLGISSVAELAEKLKSGAIREAFGDRLEMHVREGLETRPRLLLRKASQIASSLEEDLSKTPGVTRLSQTGSLRRRCETVEVMRFSACGTQSRSLFRKFARLGEIEQSSDTKPSAALRLPSGHAVELAWTSPTTWGLQLLKDTGAPAHLQELANLARDRRIRLTPKGLAARKIDASQEEPIYHALGLPFIEPELREGRGEIGSAQQGTLPTLVTLDDLKGDLHMHTVASDGANSIAEMTDAARARGYRYIAITDHSQSLKLTNGLSEKRLLEQIKQIDKLNAKLDGFVILKASEVDILEDGSLDYPPSVLKELDLTICSIHSKFRLDRRQQTDRILRAMDNPFFKILGHATGRMLLKRPGYEIDIERILAHAGQVGCYLEINANPNRLDLSDVHARLAKELGVKIAINTDAHSIAELGLMPGGVDQARRAWLENADILNAAPLPKLRKFLKR